MAHALFLKGLQLQLLPLFALGLGDHITLGMHVRIDTLIIFGFHEIRGNLWASVLIGYVLYTIYLFRIRREALEHARGTYFCIICVCAFAILFEAYALFSIYSGSYAGQYSMLGLFLFLLCMYLKNRIRVNRYYKTNLSA